MVSPHPAASTTLPSVLSHLLVSHPYDLDLGPRSTTAPPHRGQVPTLLAVARAPDSLASSTIPLAIPDASATQSPIVIAPCSTADSDVSILAVSRGDLSVSETFESISRPSSVDLRYFPLASM